MVGHFSTVSGAREAVKGMGQRHQLSGLVKRKRDETRRSRLHTKPALQKPGRAATVQAGNGEKARLGITHSQNPNEIETVKHIALLSN